MICSRDLHKLTRRNIPASVLLAYFANSPLREMWIARMPIAVAPVSSRP